MTTDATCKEMFAMSVEASTQLIQASSMASSGMAMTFMRSINLSLAIMAGMLCIYLGWKLYRDTVVSKTSGDFSWREIRIKLSASSPGVFLVLFGAWLIFSVVSQRVNFNMSHEEVPATQTSSLGASPHIPFSNIGVPIRLAKSESQPNCNKQCAIFKSLKGSVNGYDGSVGLVTSHEIEKSLDYAIAAIKRDVAVSMQTNPQLNLEEPANVLRILGQLRAEVAQDDI